MEDRSKQLHQIASGAMWSAISTVLTLLMGPPVTVLLVRSMSDSQVGTLAVGTTVIGLLSSVAGLGIASGVARTAAFHAGRSGAEGLARTTTAALRVSVTAMVPIALVLFGVVLALRTSSTLRGTVPVVLVLAPSVVLLPLLGSLRGFHYASQRARLLELTGVASMAVVVGLTIALIAAHRATALSIGGARVAGTFVVAAILGTSLWRWWGSNGPFAAEERRPAQREILAISIPMLFASLSWVAISQLDVLLVGAFRGASSAGLYAPVSRLSDSILGVGGIVGAYLMPALTTNVARDRHGEVAALYHWTTRWCLVLGAPFLGVLLVAPAQVLRFLYGDSYGALAHTARVLALGALVSFTFGANGVTIESFGRAGLVAWRSALGLVTSVACCFVLIPRYGYIGGAIATAGAYLVVNVTCSWMLARRFGILPWDRALGATYVAFLAGLGVAAVLAATLDDDLLTCVVVALATGAPTLFVSARAEPSVRYRLRHLWERWRARSGAARG